MKIKVMLNKDVAFSGYLRHVLNMERWPWIRRGPLEKVPKELTKKAIKFSGPVKLSFERHPMLDMESFNKEFKNVLDTVEKLHNEEWEKHLDELETVSARVENLCNMYGNFILDSIAKSTGIKWPGKEVWLIPSIYSGGTVVDNKIFIGFESMSENAYIGLLVHELIHINIGFRFQKNLTLPTDSNEIATDLLTDKVIEKLNNKFRLDIRPQGFHSYFVKFIKKYEKDLNKLGKNKKSYESLVLAIDKFLKGEKYSGYYTKFPAKETKKYVKQ